MTLFQVRLLEAEPDPSRTDFVASAGQYIRHVRAVYDRRAHWHRRLFRLSGALVILSGASLPLLNTLVFSGKALTISLVGVLIAVATALRGFYHWDQAWVLMRLTEFAITETYNEWLAEITREPDLSAEAAAYARRQATIRALEKVAARRRAEIATYFKDLRFPEKEH